MIRKIAALLLVSTLATASTALAGPREGDASFSVNAGSLMFDKAEKLDDGPIIDLRIGYDLHRNLGLEGSFSFADTRSNRSASKPQAYAYAYRADLLYYLLPESPIVPYLAVGGGLMALNGSETWGNRNSLLLEYGLGLKYFLADNLALRCDGRNLLSFDNNRHSHLEATAGINYYFSKGKAAAVRQAALTGSEQVVAERPDIVPAKNRNAPAKTEMVAMEKAAAGPASDAPYAATTPVSHTLRPYPQVTAAPVDALAAGAAQSQTVNVKPVALPAVAVVNPAKAEPAAVTAPACCSACPTVREITRIIAGPNGFEILADSELDMPREITLVNPNRLVLDVDCTTNATGSKELLVRRNGVSVVRLGSYPDKLRIVFDFDGAVPLYRIKRSQKGLKLLFGNSAKS